MSNWYEKPLTGEDKKKLPGLLEKQTLRTKQIMEELDKVKEVRLSSWAAIVAIITGFGGWALALVASLRELSTWIGTSRELLIIAGIGMAAFAIYATPVALVRFRQNQAKAAALRKELDLAGMKLQKLVRLSSQLEEHLDLDFSASLNIDFILLDAEAVLREIYARSRHELHRAEAATT